MKDNVTLKTISMTAKNVFTKQTHFCNNTYISVFCYFYKCSISEYNIIIIKKLSLLTSNVYHNHHIYIIYNILIAIISPYRLSIIFSEY